MSRKTFLKTTLKTLLPLLDPLLAVGPFPSLQDQIEGDVTKGAVMPHILHELSTFGVVGGEDGILATIELHQGIAVLPRYFFIKGGGHPHPALAEKPLHIAVEDKEVGLH